MSFRGLACGAAVVLALATSQADAAWNNAFQVTCFRCKNRASQYTPAPVAPVIAYSAPAADPCSCCQTCYVQRCYYQPVTTYKKVLEPVQQQRTSYYWEPVCTQRTSCYIDPCTGCPIQVTKPEVSYRLRSKCDTVTCYVERCVPVTTYRIAHRLEAVTVCPPGVTPPGSGRVTEQPPFNGVNPNPNYIRTPQGPMAEPGRITDTPAAPGSLKKPSAIRMDKVTGRTNDGAFVRGQVVAKNFVTPMRGAKVLFVSKESETKKLDATADPAGRFAVSLPAGGWKIYLSSRDGSLEYHSSIDVQDAQNRNVMVVSR